MKALKITNANKGKEIVAYLRGEKCTFQDVIDEIASLWTEASLQAKIDILINKAALI